MSALVATRVMGLCTVQDLGRPGRMHEALAPGGALVPSRLVRANLAVGNRADAAALEVCGQLQIRAERTLVIATDRELARRLDAGDSIDIVSEPARVTYLAVRGGVDAPLVLGSRATQLSAGIGRPLRRGDGIDAIHAPEPSPTVELGPLPATAETTSAIRIRIGPDREAFPPDALSRFLAQPYRIASSSDRVGTRLRGAPIPRLPGSMPTGPMVLGAIEIPGDGQPIILGPEHPTTGGYPILAVVLHADIDRCFATRLGSPLGFTLP